MTTLCTVHSTPSTPSPIIAEGTIYQGERFKLKMVFPKVTLTAPIANWIQLFYLIQTKGIPRKASKCLFFETNAKACSCVFKWGHLFEFVGKRLAPNVNSSNIGCEHNINAIECEGEKDATRQCNPFGCTSWSTTRQLDVSWWQMLIFPFWIFCALPLIFQWLSGPLRTMCKDYRKN